MHYQYNTVQALCQITQLKVPQPTDSLGIYPNLIPDTVDNRSTCGKIAHRL